MTRPPWIRRHLDDDGRYPARDVGPFANTVWMVAIVLALVACALRGTCG